MTDLVNGGAAILAMTIMVGFVGVVLWLISASDNDPD